MYCAVIPAQAWDEILVNSVNGGSAFYYLKSKIVDNISGNTLNMYCGKCNTLENIAVACSLFSLFMHGRILNDCVASVLTYACMAEERSFCLKICDWFVKAYF